MLTQNYDAHTIVNNQICPVNVNAEKNLGLFKEILQRMTTQLENILSYHSKILLTRLDLRCNQNSNNNKHISKIISKIKQCLKRRYQLSRLGYVWVREQHTAYTPHYHLVLMLDDHKVKNSWKLNQLFKHYWENRYDYGSVGFAKNADYNIKRSQAKPLTEAVKRMSYLAKINTKPIKQSMRLFGCSRILHKQHKDSLHIKNPQQQQQQQPSAAAHTTSCLGPQAKQPNVLQRYLANHPQRHSQPRTLANG